MLHRWIIVFLILPGNVLFIIPGLLLYLFRNTYWAHSVAGPSNPEFWLAVLFCVGGSVLSIWTISLFFRSGSGTPAPWDPVQELIIRGPYRYVRNPMITGVFLILFAEFLFFQSWPLLIWLMIFIVANVVYIPLVEEKGLEKRFGNKYILYKRHVPRWIPRLTAWLPMEEESEKDR